ncbi:MAG TPA: hypothetical protein VN088_08600 [Nocardioides sp.]|nr:hypothetical protein [Nocardioides sp.]
MPKPAAMYAALLPLALLLTACGGGGSGAKPAFPSDTPALWNPCDALDPALVHRSFGVQTKEDDGTPSQPNCSFTPIHRKTDKFAVSANYQLTPFDLQAYFKAMHLSKKADVRRPTIAQADDARMVVHYTTKLMTITGFVKNGDLFQIVNVVDPAPYTVQRDVAGTEAVLTALSKHADETGAGASASPTATVTEN